MVSSSAIWLVRGAGSMAFAMGIGVAKRSPVMERKIEHRKITILFFMNELIIAHISVLVNGFICFFRTLGSLVVWDLRDLGIVVQLGQYE